MVEQQCTGYVDDDLLALLLELPPVGLAAWKALPDAAVMAQIVR
jgi:hypothetical protein